MANIKTFGKNMRWVFLCCIPLLFASCIAPTYRLYAGSSRPSAEIAVLKSSPSVYVDSVDGITACENIADKSWGEKVVGGYQHPLATPLEKKEWYGRVTIVDFRIELLPGPHTLSVRYGGWHGKSVQNLEIAFTAEAGKTYTIKHWAKTEKSTMTPYGRGWKTETEGSWNAWVEEVRRE
jgi:hypothetical protein